MIKGHLLKIRIMSVCCDVLQYVALCCNVLQRVSVRDSVLQYATVCSAECCSVFPVYCSVLQ